MRRRTSRRSPLGWRTNPTTQVARFRYGTCFPTDDAVGKFVIGLGAALNELLLLNSLLYPPDDPERDDFTASERNLLIRWLLACVWEQHLFVQDAIADPAVARFLGDVVRAYPAETEYTGAELVAFLKGEDGATRPALRNVLRVARLATFHMPKIGDPRLNEALELLEDDEGEFSMGSRMPSLRCSFAEHVIMNVAVGDRETELTNALKSLAPTVIAVVHLAQIAIDLWLGRRGGVRMLPIDNAKGSGPSVQ